MSHGDDAIRVLLVDDEADLCDLAALHLKRANDALDVVTETSARDGIDRLAAEPIDCVVSDHDMPGMDGLDFLRAVRERDEDVPFVLFTGKGSEEIASEAISAGVTDYLQKRTTTDQYDLLANRIEHGVSEVRARDALAESERMFSTLVANLPGMVYRCRNEPGWPMEFVSEGAKELTGYDASAIESGAVSWEGDVIDGTDRESTWDVVQRAVAAGEPFEITYRIRTADDEKRWVWERGRTVEDGGTDVEILEGFITDITARRTRERELEAERRFTRRVVDALEDVFVVVEPDGSIVRWNDHTAAATGYTDEDIAGLTLADLFDASASDRLRDARETALANGAATFEAALLTAEEETRPYEVRLAAVAVEGEEDGYRRLCGIGRDLTPVRERETELERYETIVQAVGDPMYTLDATGRVTFANDALSALTGRPREALVGEHIERIMTRSDVEAAREEIVALLRSDDRENTIFEMDVLTEDGEAIPCETHIALLPMPDGEFRGTAGVVRDVSERKARERRLEEFASVVSHDLRNPLEVLAGRVELAKETGDVSHLEEVDRPLDRMGQLIEDLLRLAHHGEVVDETSKVDLATAARAAWDSIDTDTATLQVAGSRTLEADLGRFQALLENLFRNSLEHGSQGESDPIAVAVGDTEEGFFVADDGVGIPEADRDAVFERGFTTRVDGTGYGLSIVEGVADAHDWEVRVTNGDRGGARFDVLL